MVLDRAVSVPSLVQMLSLEIGLGCNLASRHRECPCSLGAARYTNVSRDHFLDDATIEAVIARFHAAGFRSWVNFSYYNEPLMVADRLWRLSSWVQQRYPDLPMFLVTNGTLLPPDLTPFQRFRMVHITDYGTSMAPDPARVAALIAVVGPRRHRKGRLPTGLWVNPGVLDTRLNGPEASRRERPCRIPFKDFAVDCFGNVHLCCYDWRGHVALGNVLSDPLEHIWDRWRQVVRQIAGLEMRETAPETCQHCRFGRNGHFTYFDATAAERARRWVTEEGLNDGT